MWPDMTTEWKASHILQKGNSSTDFMTVGGSKSIEATYDTRNPPSELV